MLKISILLSCLFLYAVVVEGGIISTNSSRSPKNFYSPLVVYKFENGECESDVGDKKGICYTEEQCEGFNGQISGNCASNFGVCCLVDAKPDTVTNFKIAHISNESFEDKKRSARYRICKAHKDICAFYVVFNKFVLPLAPFTDARRGICTKSEFTMTSDGNIVPKNMCGTNSGEHIYVRPEEDGCSTMTFDNLDGITEMEWNVVVRQIPCGSSQLPPNGCLQYYPEERGSFQSFNRANNVKLRNQRYAICFRGDKDKSKRMQLDVTDINLGLTDDGHGQLRLQICSGSHLFMARMRVADDLGLYILQFPIIDRICGSRNDGHDHILLAEPRNLFYVLVDFNTIDHAETRDDTGFLINYSYII